MSKYVVSMQGEHVWHGVSIKYVLDEVTEENLNLVRELIEKKYNIKVEQFHNYNYWWKANTSDKEVDIYIEEVREL